MSSLFVGNDPKIWPYDATDYLRRHDLLSKKA
jgi:hypothetical protein